MDRELKYLCMLVAKTGLDVTVVMLGTLVHNPASPGGDKLGCLWLNDSVVNLGWKLEFENEKGAGHNHAITLSDNPTCKVLF